MRGWRSAVLLGVLVLLLLSGARFLLPRTIARSHPPAPSPVAPERAPSVDPEARPAPAEGEQEDRTISVLTVDGDGKPIGGAEVVAIPENLPRYGEPQQRASVVTGADGHATVRLPAEWGRPQAASIGATAPDGLAASPPVRANPGDDVRLVLGPSYSIRGRVTGCSAQEFPGVRVHAYCESWPEAPYHVRAAGVDDEGRFVIPAVRGFAGLTATAPGRAPSRRWSAQCFSSQDGVELSLGPWTQDVAVTLVDSSGKPLPAGTPVRYQSGEHSAMPTYLRPQGAATLAYVSGETLQIWPDPVPDPAGGWRSARWHFELPVAEIRDGVVLSVPRPPAVRFQVRDAKGQPIRGLPVVMQTAAENGAGSTGFTGTTDDHGDWEPLADFPDVVGLQAVLLVGGAPAWRGDLPVGALETRLVTLRDTWTVVPVTLVDWSGTPVSSPNISVAAVDAAYRGIASVDNVSRGVGTPYYAFDTPVVRMPLREAVLSTGQLSVLEIGHRERLMGMRAEGVTVTPSPDTGAVRVLNWRDEWSLALTRNEKRGFPIVVKTGTAYGLAPGEYSWELSRPFMPPARGSVPVRAGFAADIEPR